MGVVRNFPHKHTVHYRFVKTNENKGPLGLLYAGVCLVLASGVWKLAIGKTKKSVTACASQTVEKRI